MYRDRDGRTPLEIIGRQGDRQTDRQTIISLTLQKTETGRPKNRHRHTDT